MRLLCINYEYPPIGGGGASVCQGLAEALTTLDAGDYLAGLNNDDLLKLLY